MGKLYADEMFWQISRARKIFVRYIDAHISECYNPFATFLPIKYVKPTDNIFTGG